MSTSADLSAEQTLVQPKKEGKVSVFSYDRMLRNKNALHGSAKIKSEPTVRLWLGQIK